MTLAPDQRVKVKGRRGEYVLQRPAVSQSGTLGWWAIGPDGKHHAIRTIDIKEGKR